MNRKTFFKVVTVFSVFSMAVLAPVVSASGSKQVTVPKSFGSSRIDDFQIVDNQTIIFDVSGMGNLVAEVSPGCHGLRFATTLAVRDRAFELSRGSTLLLSHGERCSITSLTRLENKEMDDSE